MNDFHDIRYIENQGVATIVLNRPDAYNAFTPKMNQEVIQALRTAEKSDQIGCIVITGAGKGFSAGEDLAGVDENTNHAEFLRERYHPMMKAIKQTSKPLVAAVNGTAAGAGMSLALAADFRLVLPKTKFVSAFTDIGLVPDSGLLFTLPRMVGYAKAMEIVVLGKPVGGEEAYGLNLATEVIEANHWEERVDQFAGQLAEMPTQAIGLIKRYMFDGMNEPFETMLEKEAQAQRAAGQTNDHKEGLQAFKEKRKPVFTGR